MGIGQGGRRNHVAGAKEVIGRGNVVSRFVPVVRQAQQGQVREVDAYEEQGKDKPEGQRTVERGLLGRYGNEFLLLFPANIGLVDWALRHDRGPWFEGNGAEGVLVLEQVLLQHIAQRLGLLRAEVNGLEGVDGDLFGRFLIGGAEGESEIPDALLYLNAVGIALAVVGRALQDDVRL